MSSGTLRVDTKRKLTHIVYRSFEQTMASHAQLHPRFADESTGLAANEHGSFAANEHGSCIYIVLLLVIILSVMGSVHTESSCVCVSSVSLSVQRRSCFVARRTLAVYNAVTVIEVRRAADRDPGSCVLRYMHRQDRDERRTCRLKNLYGVL